MCSVDWTMFAVCGGEIGVSLRIMNSNFVVVISVNNMEKKEFIPSKFKYPSSIISKLTFKRIGTLNWKL